MVLMRIVIPIGTLSALLCSGLTAMGLSLMAPAGFALESPELRAYAPEYFQQFSPKSALDMAEQIPGFTISGGNNNGRGLGQGSGNVLINGARISGKSVSARETLERIPAGNVTGMAIVDGARLSIPGLSGDVLDVTTRPSQFSGTWEWRPEFREVQEPNILRGKIAASGQMGKWTYTAALDADATKRGDDGPEVLRDADGQIFETAQERYRISQQAPEATLALRYDYSDDITANFTARYRQRNRNETESSDRRAVTSRGETVRTVFGSYRDETEGEISADLAFPMAGGQIKLIGISGFEDTPSGRSIRFFSASGLTDRTKVFTQSDEGERIARAEYNRVINDNDWQISAETAFNFVDRYQRVYALDNGELGPVLSDDPQVRIEEDRAEIAITHSRALTEKLDLQASIAVEKSKLKQSLNSADSREFIRPKGFANFSYAASPSLTARLEIGRVVDQLDFFDFLSDIDIQDDMSTDSNPELVPQQYWNLTAEIDKTVAGNNTFLMRVFYKDFEDLVTRVPLGIDGDAIGNVDSADALGLNFESTLRGERWGLDGMQLDLEYFGQKTRMSDPVTGETVRISDQLNTFYGIEFRHDVPGTDWAWGLRAQEERNAQARDPEEISGDFSTGPFTDVFIERKNFYGMTVNVRLLNPPDFENGSRRTVFTGRRDSSEIDFTSKRRQAYGRFLRFTISGTF